MVTLEQFVSKYLGQTKGYPTDEYYKGQCLSIVKLYIKECFGIDPPPSGTNSAYGYWSNFPSPLGTVFEKVVNTDELIPEPGWIAIWQPWASNEYGHIAIVAEGSTTSTLKNYAQNWTSKVFQLESNRYTNVVGFLKPINTMTQDEQRALEALKRYQVEAGHGNLEGAVNHAIGAAKDIENLKNETASQKEIIQTQSEIIVGFQAETKEKGELIQGLQTGIETANKKIDKISQNLADTEADRDAWRKRYNDKTAELNQDMGERVQAKLDAMTAGDHFALFIHKLFKK